MARWHAAAFVGPVVVVAAAAACSSFESAVEDVPVDAGTDQGRDSTPEPPPAEAGADAAKRTRVHVFGGYTDNLGAVLANDAWSADVLPDGGLAAWAATPELASPRYFAATTTTANGRVLSAGGVRKDPASVDPPEPSAASVDIASLDPLTKFSPGVPLEFGVQSPAGASHGSFVYVTGGISGASIMRNEVFVSSFDGNGGGALLPWSKTTPLAVAIGRHAVASLGDFLYSCGGAYADDGGFTPVTETFRARISPDGTLSAWTQTGSLPAATSFLALVAVTGRLYAIGGRLESGPTANVYVATPTADGDVTWAASTPLPAPLAASCAVVANDRIYVTGGFAVANTAPVTKVYVGSVGASGGLSWSESADLPIGRGGHGCAAF